MSSEETLQFWIQQGDSAFNQGNYSDALASYSQALQQDRSNVSLLSKIGNTCFSLHFTEVAQAFYFQAFTHSNSIHILYEYALTPLHTQNLPLLQQTLQTTYNISITITGLDYMITTITHELQEPSSEPQKRQLFSTSVEQLVSTLLSKAGIPFSEDLFHIAHLFQKITTPSPHHHYPLTFSNKMSWQQFEDFFYYFFQDLGYQVTKTKRSHDQGVDLLLRRDNEYIAVQIKKRAKPIGVRGIQEINTGRDFYHTDRAVLISNSGFTKPALELAATVGVECFNGKQILQELYKQRYFPPP